MQRYLVKKIVLLIPTILLISLLAFSFTFFSPGNTAELIMLKKSPETAITKEKIEAYEEILGINKPFFELYSQWALKAAKGDLGESLDSSKSVYDVFGERFRITGPLIILSTLFYLLIGSFLGVLSAYYKDRVPDKIIRMISSLSQSVPSFWIGLLLIWVLSVGLKVSGIFGYRSLKSLLLPSFVMGLSGAGGFSRVIRGVTIEAIESRYVLMATSSGMAKQKIFFIHILKNILNTAITLVGMHTIALLGGSLIIENVFGLPGVGKTLIEAVNLKDFPIISGFLLLIGIMIVVINNVIDILYAIVDPRVRVTHD